MTSVEVRFVNGARRDVHRKVVSADITDTTLTIVKKNGAKEIKIDYPIGGVRQVIYREP